MKSTPKTFINFCSWNIFPKNKSITKYKIPGFEGECKEGEVHFQKRHVQFHLCNIIFSFLILSLVKNENKPAHNKGIPDNANTLMQKALIQGHIINSDIFGY